MTTSLIRLQDLPKHMQICRQKRRILVSPFMYFDTDLKITDIIMFNSRNLGALIVDEKPHVKSWDEPQYSIQNLAIEESYGFGVLNEGQAIAVPRVRAHIHGMFDAAGARSSCAARTSLFWALSKPPVVNISPDLSHFRKSLAPITRGLHRRCSTLSSSRNGVVLGTIEVRSARPF